MRSYRGFRDVNGVAHVEVCLHPKRERGHRRQWLDPRLKLANHSPTGLEWGFSGSGPAQLALALLADALGDNARALRLHRKFKFAVVANLPRAGWTLTSAAITVKALEIEAQVLSGRTGQFSI